MRNLLGQGAYGKVISKNGKAVKSFAKLSHVIQEYVALKYLDDAKYIVKASKVNFSEKKIYMKLYDTNLGNWLKEKEENGNISVEDLTTATHDILCGLIELHDRGLTHGDLKPGNILVREKPLKVVIGDCGFVSLSKYAKVERTARVYRDLDVKHSNKHDIYSFGMIYFNILTGIKFNRPPKDYDEIHNLIKNKVKDKVNRKILLGCLNPHHSKRPSAREIYDTLFGDDFEKWKPAKEIKTITEFEEITSSSKDSWYENTIRGACKKYGLNRAQKACLALKQFFKTEHIDKNKHDIYVACTLLILSSVFGRSSKFAKNNASSLCNYKYEEDEIYECLEKLVSNSLYLNIIMSK